MDALLHGASRRRPRELGGARRDGSARRDANNEREYEEKEDAPWHGAGGYRHTRVHSRAVAAGDDGTREAPGKAVVPRDTRSAGASGRDRPAAAQHPAGVGRPRPRRPRRWDRLRPGARPPRDGPDPEPGIAALLPGAVLGMALEARACGRGRRHGGHALQRRGAQGDHAGGGAARVRPLEDRLWHWNEVACREQTRNQAQASALIPVIVQQVTENVIVQLDFVRIVEQIPVDDIAGAIHVEAIVQRIDLGGVIRESTMGLTMETVDAYRSEAIEIDGWAPGVVDKVLRRKGPRYVAIGDGS